jgi:hypothetical protein
MPWLLTKKDVNGRDKPGHDEMLCGGAPAGIAIQPLEEADHTNV